MTDPLEIPDLSHLSDEECWALCPQGFHGTGDFESLSPAAKAILDAYFTHADLLNREVSHEEMIAAAIRALADQLRLELPLGDTDADAGVFAAHSAICATILAIADKLES